MNLKSILALILFAALGSGLSARSAERLSLNLMPVPASVVLTRGAFRLESDFAVGVHGDAGGRLYRGATRMLRRLSGRTGLFFPQHFLSAENAGINAAMKIEVGRPGVVELGEDESYELTVAPDGIVLRAGTDIGALRGMETLLQLLEADSAGYYIPAVEIRDAPRFQWRGLLIDVCRHFLPVEVIRRNLDGMAAVKMNVLHLHLSEDQGFRVECLTYPRLHQMGSDGFYFTQEQIRDIIRYADDRGIRVLPEFDMPGHATSWLVGYPELASAPGPYTLERKWGIMDPVMDPTRESTYEFLDAFFREMCALFPDAYMHIGGDENNGVHWNANAGIQAFMKKNGIPDNHALQSYFNNRVLKILTANGKKMVGWDEILHPDMPTSIVIQSWRGRDALVRSAQQGYMGLLSNGYYIDLIQPTDFHYLNDPLPADSPLNDEEKARILGGEATMWSEYVGPETVDSRIWPRSAAIAERLWSPGALKDVGDMYRRLDTVSLRLEELGLLHLKNPAMMLRRLAGGLDTAPLEILVNVVEPVKIYQRGAQRDYTSTSPLTRVVDAAVPDAEAARRFRGLVDRFLSGESGLAAGIESRLAQWQTNHELLLPVIEKSPVLREIESLSVDLSRVARLGREALAHIGEKNAATREWLDNASGLLEKAREPRGQVELMIVPAVEKLVQRAAER